MSSKQALGDRMKESYEFRAQTQLLRRTGRAFHTWTRGCTKPFDQNLIDCMASAARMVAADMQGFKMGFVQSDEASFILTDYDDLTSDAWFDYKVQKVASISASLMTAYFNIYAREFFPDQERPAMFDARCFNLPESEISNYLLFRAKDWERNSLQMFARASFSQKQLHGKNREAIHELLYTVGKNWATDTTEQQRNGSWVSREGFITSDVQPTWPSIDQFRNFQMRKRQSITI